jgi:hypothetical protein
MDTDCLSSNFDWDRLSVCWDPSGWRRGLRVARGQTCVYLATNSFEVGRLSSYREIARGARQFTRIRWTVKTFDRRGWQMAGAEVPLWCTSGPIAWQWIDLVCLEAFWLQEWEWVLEDFHKRSCWKNPIGMSVPLPYRSDVYVCSKSFRLCLTVVCWLLECNIVPSWIENPSTLQYVYRICIKWQQYFGALQTATVMCSTVHIPGFRSRLGNWISWDVLWFPSVHILIIYNTPLSNYFIVIVITKMTVFNKWVGDNLKYIGLYAYIYIYIYIYCMFSFIVLIWVAQKVF